MAENKNSLGIGCCGFELFALIFISIFVIALVWGGKGSIETASSAPSGNLSSVVPPNMAILFKEAGSKFDLDPALIAAIFLTEHHVDGFGADIPSVDAYEDNCSSNSSKARGPMQIIDSTWNGIVGAVQKAGIANPDRCKFRDAFYGGAAVIRAKISPGGQTDARTACGISRNNLVPNYTDDCIRKVGRAYCGACTGPACGTKGYNYCEQNLKHYNIAKGTLAYLPPLLINDKERKLCYINIEN